MSLTQEIPEIYRLIHNDASSEELAAQMIKQGSGPSKNRKALYLGFQELLDRGQDGIRMFTIIAKEVPGLAAVVSSLRVSPNLTGSELEKVLEMENRFGEVIDKQVLTADELEQKTYEYGIKRGYVDRNISFREFKSLVESEVARAKLRKFSGKGPAYEPNQLTGRMEHTPRLIDATFGRDEASYLEVMTPSEVLRMRAKERADILLLGSLGVYSARHFNSLAKKLGPNVNPKVVELHPRFVDLIKNDKRAENVRDVAQGDVLSLPYPKSSIDQVYSNSLFHSLVSSDGLERDEMLERLFEQVELVLKNDGKFIIVEQAYGDFIASKDIDGMREEIEEIANDFGLVTKNELPVTYAYQFFPDIGTPRIDEYGFAHYGDFLLRKDDAMVVKMFEKE